VIFTIASFFLAEHDADRGRFVLFALVAVEVVHVHLHLAQILVGELAE
jgi:hypothetical protein